MSHSGWQHFSRFSAHLRPKYQSASDLRLVDRISRRAFTCATKDRVINCAALLPWLTREAKSGVAVNLGRDVF
jgi:hypothetical protein